MTDPKPCNYTIEFEPDLGNFTFDGKESITIDCPKATNTIVLNAAELEIHNCSIKKGKENIPVKVALDEKREEMRIRLPKKISGRAVIDIEFSGVLNDRLLGFYRSKYEYKNKTKYLATTQFEAADARRAFPCWDRPDAKATFDISIVTDREHMAISNMPEISHKRRGKKIVHQFATTPPMSTYLVYLGVGEFESISDRQGDVKMRVITTKGNSSKGRFALDLAKRLLKAYEDYFGIKYPLPKLDLIAVPDFAAGAMENWGAITFRETILLYDKKTSSTKTKQFIAEVVSHEMAHQWFGNLVTMAWWNDLWLNESFATFMATKFVDMFYPQWDLWDQFREDAMNPAMALDALKSSHPIDVKVRSPAQIREIFDAISYDKGGCVLLMLENFVGEKDFRRGLKSYLKEFRFGNAKGDDLWRHIEKRSGLPVRSMVNTWIRQTGFPLVEVSQKGSSLLLNQKRFLLESKKAKGLWHIPITVGTKHKQYKALMTTPTKRIRIKEKDFGHVVNFGRDGFYRVKYEEGLVLELKYKISEGHISSTDRWAIQNDLFALCIGGRYSVRKYLDFLDAYIDEDNYLVTMDILANLNVLYLRTFHEPFAGEIHNYARNYFRNVFERLGWDPKTGEKHTDAMLRGHVISFLGRLGDQQILEEAKSRFLRFLKEPESLKADLREPVFSLVAWQGNNNTYKRLLGLFDKAQTQEEKLRFLSAMCSFSKKELLKKTLDFSQTDKVRSQNMQLPIIRVSANPYGRDILWPWLKRNWKRLSKKVGHGNPLFNRIVASIAAVADSSMEKEILQFFEENPTPGTERTLKQTIERIRIYTKFQDNMRKEFGV